MSNFRFTQGRLPGTVGNLHPFTDNCIGIIMKTLRPQASHIRFKPTLVAQTTGALCAMFLAGAVYAAPTITFSPAVTLCATDCRPVGGVGLAGDQLGFLIIDSSSGSDVARFVVVDKVTAALVSDTVLGGSAGYDIADVAADGAGGAWIVGTLADNGTSVPGRWHSSDLATVEVPVSFSGNTELSLLTVAQNGTAFGVTNDNLATRVPVSAAAVNLADGLMAQLPTAIVEANASGSAAVGNARSGPVLALAAWSGDTLSFQDNVAGGNGVIGTREDAATVLVGLRFPAASAELGVFVDPFGSPTYTVLGTVVSAQLFGMDHYGFGYAFGSIDGEATLIDTNALDMVTLADAGLGSYQNLVSMDYLGNDEWLLVMEDSVHYTLAQINSPAPDSDGDGIADGVDNCTNVANPAQNDGDGDLIGNICDADLNNDCIVNPVDLGIFRTLFFSNSVVADLNSDGIVNPVDLGIFRTLFFQPPGPGAAGNVCE